MKNFITVVCFVFVTTMACTTKKLSPTNDTYFTMLRLEPATINPISAKDIYAADVHSYLFDSLIGRDPITYKFIPGLADKWEVSKDQLTFTFHLRPETYFHDGQPVKVQDIKFSFDVTRDDRFDNAEMRPYFENFKSCKIIDDHTVQFVSKTRRFNNFVTLGSMTILPKYFFDDPKKKYETLIGSGPYKFTEYNRGKNILITRNDKWWGFHVEPYKNYFHFPKIYFRFIPEDDLRLEMLKKGDLDVVNPLSPESFQIKAQGDPWGRTVFKKQVENLLPVETQHIAWNLKNPLFANRDVRVALAHLMNREMMNEKFLYNMDRLSTGPWYQKNPYADPTVKPISFDPTLAQELLKKAGFSDADHSGILKKVINGKNVEFRFTLVFVRRELERFLTVYKEDLKKVGIELNLKIVDWTTFTKSLDERKFEAVAFGWSGGAIDVDPSGLWHSAATRPGGLNFISYMNPDVDKNIDLARAEMDNDKRQVLLNKVYRQIAEDAPYLFMFEQRYLMYAHSKRIHIDHPVFPYSLGEETWRFE